MKRIVTLMTGFLLLTACGDGPSTADEQAMNAAADFAQAYFDYDYQAARKLATPESEKWLRYAASNVTRATIELFNEQQQGASVSVDDFYWADDSTAVVAVYVSDYVVSDSIGAAPRLVDEGLFRLKVINRNGEEYYVKMEGPLRSERQSRD